MVSRNPKDILGCWQCFHEAVFVYICGVCMLSHFSRVQPFVTLWTVAHQAPLSMGFSRQEYWSGLPYLPPGDLPDPGIEPTFLTSPALAGGFFTTSATWEAHISGSFQLKKKKSNPQYSQPGYRLIPEASKSPHSISIAIISRWIPEKTVP